MYLDPGFGSMVIQLVLAGLAVAGSVFYLMRKKIAGLFKGKKKHDDAAAQLKQTPDVQQEKEEQK